MNRVMLCAMCLLLVCPVLAQAADGTQAEVSISLAMDSAMFEMEGADAADMPEMEPMLMTGDMYWTADAMRFELNLGVLGGQVVSLIDYQKMLAYTLDAEQKTAMEIDLNAQMASMEEMGMPAMQPDQMFTNWEDTLKLMKEMPGVTVEELGTEAVGTRDCQKISFKMDMSAMAGDAGEDAADLSALGLAGEFAGTYWVDESIQMPVRMEMQMMGMDLTWLLENIGTWTVDPAMLSVPEDYTVTSIEDMMGEAYDETTEEEVVPAA